MALSCMYYKSCENMFASWAFVTKLVFCCIIMDGFIVPEPEAPSIQVAGLIVDMLVFMVIPPLTH